jgi:hypothetical protein
MRKTIFISLILTCFIGCASTKVHMLNTNSTEVYIKEGRSDVDLQRVRFKEIKFICRLNDSVSFEFNLNNVSHDSYVGWLAKDVTVKFKDSTGRVITKYQTNQYTKFLDTLNQ